MSRGPGGLGVLWGRAPGLREEYINITRNKLKLQILCTFSDHLDKKYFFMTSNQTQPTSFLSLHNLIEDISQMLASYKKFSNI